MVIRGTVMKMKEMASSPSTSDDDDGVGEVKYPWDNQDEPVEPDIAGCRPGLVDRPASEIGTEFGVTGYFGLKMDGNSDAWLVTDSPAELSTWT